MTSYHTHPDYLALLQAVRSQPGDDLRRLVLADWLDENGHDGRAEFVRLQVAYARSPFGPDDPRFARSQSLMMRLVEAVSDDWAREHKFDRGFLTLFHHSFAAWVEHAARILPESVGLTVRLTDWPEHRSEMRHPSGRPMDYRTDPPVLAGVRLGYRLVCGKWRSDWFDVAPGGHIVSAGLAQLWPDVANWELPPDTATYRGDGRAYRITPVTAP